MKLESIVRKTQQELRSSLARDLKRMGYEVCSRSGFLYAEGAVPVLLVAHLDTVHKRRVKTICYSTDGDVVMSPEGIGGDDRAGVYMILQLLQRYKCHVLFCEDEEIGGIGARCFTKSGIKPEVNYIVEFDRAGDNDAVFYDCENPEFTQFVCSFGFKEDLGSFSDISIIAPSLGVAAVNISSGYHNAHTLHEYIRVSQMRRNIDLVARMVNTVTGPFVYIPAPLYALHDYFGEYARTEWLAPAPAHSYVVNAKGEFVEYPEGVWVDKKGAPYEYLWEFGVALELQGLSVHTEHGLHVRFDEQRAEQIDVVPEEFLYEDAYGF